MGYFGGLNLIMSTNSASVSDQTTHILLRNLDEQFKEVLRRLPDDVESASHDSGGSGFINYYLRGADGKPLSEKSMAMNGIDMKSLTQLPFYEKLHQYCQKHYFRLVFEHYLDFSKTPSERMIKITIDGW